MHQRVSQLKLWVVAAVIGAAVLALSGGAMAALDSFEVSDEALADEFLRLLQARDREGLAEFLSPEFRVVRGDGTTTGKAEYLQSPAVVDDYAISDVVGWGVDNVRFVRYNLWSVEWIDGVELPRGPLVRLSVFHWNGERWQLLTHVNFINVQALE